MNISCALGIVMLATTFGCRDAMKRPDVLHIQAIGPALLTPLARLLGLRVVCPVLDETERGQELLGKHFPVGPAAMAWNPGNRRHLNKTFVSGRRKLFLRAPASL